MITNEKVFCKELKNKLDVYFWLKTTLNFFRLVSALQFVKTRPNGKTIVDRNAASACPPNVNYLLEFNWNAAF